MFKGGKCFPTSDLPKEPRNIKVYSLKRADGRIISVNKFLIYPRMLDKTKIHYLFRNHLFYRCHDCLRKKGGR